MPNRIPTILAHGASRVERVQSKSQFHPRFVRWPNHDDFLHKLPTCTYILIR